MAFVNVDSFGVPQNKENVASSDMTDAPVRRNLPTQARAKIQTIRALLLSVGGLTLIIAAVEFYCLTQSLYDENTPVHTTIRGPDSNLTIGNASLTCTAEDSISVPYSDKRISVCSTQNGRIKIDIRKFRKGKATWMGLDISPRELRQFELLMNRIRMYVSSHQSRMDQFQITYP